MSDPVSRALEEAPFDDEPLTEEEIRALDAAEAEGGPRLSSEEVRDLFGFGTERERTNNDLNTPEEIVELVRMVAPIALDPCSNPWSKVKARRAYDEEEDGFFRDWVEEIREAGGGLAYVNPPYGPGLLLPWAIKITTEARRGAEIISLVPGSHDTQWFNHKLEHANALCNWRGRISFDGGGHGAGKFASTLFYFGPNPYLFAHIFQHKGDVRVLNERNRR